MTTPMQMGAEPCTESQPDPTPRQQEAQAPRPPQRAAAMTAPAPHQMGGPLFSDWAAI